MKKIGLHILTFHGNYMISALSWR